MQPIAATTCASARVERRVATLPASMKILGLDMGSKRIGLAVSDEDETFAFPRGKLERQGRDKDLAALAQLIEEEAIEQIVVGVPLHMSGRQSKGAEAARAFAKALEEHTSLPVETLDERLTTVEAERALQATGRRAKDQKEVVDSVAAAIILSTYLDLRRNRGEGIGSDEA